jgi:hypothetical protein
MASSLTSQIYRVQALIGLHAEWFDIVANWYDNARATKKVMMRLYVPSVEPTCLPLLSVNGQFLDEGARDRRSTSHHFFWMIPPSSLHVGDNDIFLWVDRAKGPPMTFGAVTVEHAQTLPADVQKDARPHPLPTSQVSVIFRLGEGFRQEVDRWMAQIHHDTLKFHLTLVERVPSSLMVGVAALLPGGGYEVNFEVIWDLIEDLVKDKIKDLARELVRLQAQRDPHQRIIEMNLEDLKAYQKLHREHLFEAVKAGDSETLENIFNRTERPETLVKSAPTQKLATTGTPFGTKVFFLLILVGVAGFLAWTNGWINQATWNQIQTAWAKLNKNQPPPPPRFNPPIVINQPPAVNPPGKDQEQQLVNILKAQNAQGGDVQITLQWFNKNDLDLHVFPPSKEEIYHGHKFSKCNGRLDVDMNVGGYDRASHQPVENVFWPQGKAPQGKYKVEVRHYSNQGRPDTQDPTFFKLRIIIRGETRWFEGQVVNNDPQRKKMVYEFEVN